MDIPEKPEGKFCGNKEKPRGKHCRCTIQFIDDKIPLKYFHKDPENPRGKELKTCKWCRYYKYLMRCNTIAKRAKIAEENNNETERYCKGDHKSSGSPHPVTAVPVEYFIIDGEDKPSDYCIWCRDQINTRKRNRRAEIRISSKESKESDSDIVECPNMDHAQKISEYPRDKVPRELFKRSPEDPIKTPHDFCLDCRNYENKRSKRREESAKKDLKANAFFCRGCFKVQNIEAKGISLNGNVSTRCTKCTQFRIDRNLKLKQYLYVLKYERALEKGTSCEICKRIFLGFQGCIMATPIETFEKDNKRFISFEDKEYETTDFLTKFKEKIELRILEWDHLSPSDFIKRGIIPQDDEYKKISNVSRKRSIEFMESEIKKTQLVCRQCHKMETIRREIEARNAAGGTAQIRYGLAKEKIKLLNDIKKSGCVICSYKNEDLLRYFDFDHINPKDKKCAISCMMLNNFSLEELKQELSKTRVLCGHCHRICSDNQVDEKMKERRIRRTKAMELRIGTERVMPDQSSDIDNELIIDTELDSDCFDFDGIKFNINDDDDIL